MQNETWYASPTNTAPSSASGTNTTASNTPSTMPSAFEATDTRPMTNANATTTRITPRYAQAPATP